MAINPAVAFGSLSGNPEHFLKRYPVRIYGDAGASGQTQYVFENRGASLRPGSRLGTHNMKVTESFDIKALSGHAAPLHGVGAHVFPAHSVHMDLGVPALGFYRLDGAGPAIMLTGQLSGCAFVIQPVPGGNDLDVAHIHPTGIGFAALPGALAGLHPNAFIYGGSGARGFYDGGATRTVSIVGIRGVGGAWRIYAQKHDRTTADYRIRSVYRIYPDHTKL